MMNKFNLPIFPQPMNLIVSLTELINPQKLLKIYLKGANLFELRMDLLNKSALSQLKVWLDEVQALNLPILLTLRKQDQGGKFNGTESERYIQIKKFISYKAIIAVDIEQNAEITKDVVALCNEHSKTAIISSHFFLQSPSFKKMNELLNQFNKFQADCFKLAINLETLKSYQNAAKFLIHQNRHHPIILVGMGRFSTLSRISFPALGSLASFCHLGATTAPNQPNFKTLNKLRSVCYP